MLKYFQKEEVDLCANCRWYRPQNETCQLKKCSTNDPYVTDRDRKDVYIQRKRRNKITIRANKNH